LIVCLVASFLIFRTFVAPLCIYYAYTRGEFWEKLQKMTPFVFWMSLFNIVVLGILNVVWTYMLIKKARREWPV